MNKILNALLFGLADLKGLPAHLDRLRLITGAHYAELFFEPAANGHFKKSLVSCAENYPSIIAEASEHPFFQQLPEADKPVVYSQAQLSGFSSEQYPDRLALKNLIILPLYVQDFKMGVLILGYADDQKQEYQDLEVLTEKMAGIIAKLSKKQAFHLATQILLRRETEKELLLALSNQMAGVHTRKQLLQVIIEHVKPILNFSHVALAHVDLELGIVTPVVHDPDSVCKDDGRYELLTTSTYPINDGYLDQVAKVAAPVIYNRSESADDPRLPLYLKINFENGIEQIIIAKLKRFNKLTGMWGLFFKENQHWDESTLNLIQGIADQISIAISNIDAIEKLEQREKEKTRLLAFSNALAAIKDKYQLAHVLSQHLSEVAPAIEYCLHWTDESKTSFSPFLWDSPIMTGKLAGIVKSFSAQDTIFQKLRDASGLVDVDPGQIMAYPVYMGEEMTGVLFTSHQPPLQAEPQFLASLCAQLAVAVCNLIATEKISRQLAEINRYKEQLEEERIYLKEELETTQHYSEMIGESAEINSVYRLVSQVAATDSTVLILGETGTGKEVVARALHQYSTRHKKLMIKLNCAALPPNLIESELFGHEKGSFTGALERRIGKFELANGGTLFLDEIGEIPLELQSKLLRVLQEKEVERVGGKTTIPVNVRIIAATNRDLRQEVVAGRFRSDLYYRLNIFPIDLPPLRDRKADIPLLASHFIQRFAKKCGKKINSLANTALHQLMHYSWPGNIRELEHLMERTVLITTGDTIRNIDIPSSGQSLPSQGTESHVIKTIDENERDHIMKVLKSCKGRIGGPNGAAYLLGVPATTLSSKIKRLGIRRSFNI